MGSWCLWLLCEEACNRNLWHHHMYFTNKNLNVLSPNYGGRDPCWPMQETRWYGQSGSVPGEDDVWATSANHELIMSQPVLAKPVVFFLKEGATTEDIDRVVHQAAISFGAYPSPLNYKGFPKSVCTSVNNVAVHGVPDRLWWHWCQSVILTL